jgi:hypothetical protein
MKRLIIAMALLVALAPAASSIPVSGQTPAANIPGQPSLARMVVVNGREAAIPVVVQPGGDVQPVAIVGTPSVTVASGTELWARTLRQGWEYRTVPFAAGQDPVTALNAAGVDGWEAVGVISSAAGSGQILLKRPR